MGIDVGPVKRTHGHSRKPGPGSSSQAEIWDVGQHPVRRQMRERIGFGLHAAFPVGVESHIGIGSRANIHLERILHDHAHVSLARKVVEFALEALREKCARQLRAQGQPHFRGAPAQRVDYHSGLRRMTETMGRKGDQQMSHAWGEPAPGDSCSEKRRVVILRPQREPRAALPPARGFQSWPAPWRQVHGKDFAPPRSAPATCRTGWRRGA